MFKLLTNRMLLCFIMMSFAIHSFSQIIPQRGRYSGFDLFSFSFENKIGMFPKRPYLLFYKSGTQYVISIKTSEYSKYLRCKFYGDSVVALSTSVYAGGKGYTDNIVYNKNRDYVVHAKSFFKYESLNTVYLYSKKDSILQIDIYMIRMADKNFVGITQEYLNKNKKLGQISCKIDSKNTISFQSCDIEENELCPKCKDIIRFGDGRKFEFYLLIYLIEFPWFK